MKPSSIKQSPITQDLIRIPRLPTGLLARGSARIPLSPKAWLSALLMAGSLAVAAPVPAATASSSGGSASGSSGNSATGHAPGGQSGSASGSGHSGSSGSSGASGGSGSAGSGTAAANGPEKILQVAMPPCSTCHQVKPGVNQPGPSLAGIATRASQRIKAKDYKGKAKDAKAYIRESIMDPNAYLVPGPAYAANGKSLMPTTYAQTLKPEQIDQIVSYLMTLK